MRKKKVVVDPMGQWNNPGDITIIPSNSITMQGVNYPVLGIDNLGNQQMMMPGGSYTFPGDYVTEIPQMGKGGLTQWFAEEWTDIKTGKPCGRQEGEKRAYPACRPKKRVNETTPKTSSEMSSAEKAKFKRSKTSGERISYNHKRKEYGGENWLDTYQEGGEKTSAEELVNKINAGRGAFRPKAPNYTPTYNDLVSMYKSMPSYNSGYESLQDVDDRRAGVQRIGPLTKERTEQLASMPSEQQLLNTYLGQTFGRLPVIEGSKIYEGYSPNRIWTGKDPWIPYRYEGDTTDKPSYMYMVVPKQEGNSWNWDRPADTRGVNDFFFTDDGKLIDGTENPLWHMPKDLNVAEALFNKIGKEDASKILNKEVSDFSDLTGRDWYQLSNRTGLSSDRWFGQQTPIYWNDWQPTRKQMLKDPRILDYSEANNLGLTGDTFISGDYRSFRPSTGYQEGVVPAFSNLLIESILAKKDAELNNRAIGHATGEGYGVIQDPNQFNLVGYLPVNDILTNPYLEPMFNNAKREDSSGAAYRNMVMDMAGVPIDEELRDRVLFHTNAFPIQEYKPAQQKVGGSINWLDTYQEGGERSTAENPDRIAPVEITSKRAPWYQRLPRQIADRMGFYPYGYDTDPNDFSSQMARRMAQSADTPGGAFLGALTAPLAAPQLGMMYGLTGKVQTPSEYMGIQNPVGAFVTDAVLDPFVLNAMANSGVKAAKNLARSVEVYPELFSRARLGIQPKPVGKTAGFDFTKAWTAHPEYAKRYNNYASVKSGYFGNDMQRFNLQQLDDYQPKSYQDLLYDKGVQTYKDAKKTSSGRSYGEPAGIYVDHNPSWLKSKKYGLLSERKKLYDVNLASAETHELSHLTDGNGRFLTDLEIQAIDEAVPNIPSQNGNSFDISNGTTPSYFTEPTEVRARMMEARQQWDMTPDQQFTPEMYDWVMDQYNWFGMGPYIKDKDKFINLMNTMRAAPAVGAAGYGASQLQQQKNGGSMGWLNKYN